MVVASRVERSHKVRAVFVVFLFDVCRNGVVDVVRRVAVVRSLWLFKLIEELVIFVVPLFPGHIEALAVLEPVSFLLRKVEACQLDVEALRVKLNELVPHNRLIPAAEFSQPVVGEYVSPALFVRQSLDVNARNDIHSDLPRRLYSPMSGYDPIVPVNKAGANESKLLDALF